MSTQDKPIFSAIVGGLTLHAVIVAAAIVYVGHAQPTGTGTGMAAGPALAPQVASNEVFPLLRTDGDDSGFRTNAVTATLDSDFIYGSPEAATTLVSYVDLRCPYCVKFESVAKDVVDASDGEINLVWRLFPLQRGGDTELLAKAASCVGKVGGDAQFYAFVTQAFNSPRSVEARVAIAPILAGLNLDDAAVWACADGDAVSAEIEQTLLEANQAGVAGTPTTVVINKQTGQRSVIQGTSEPAAITALIRSLEG